MFLTSGKRAVWCLILLGLSGSASAELGIAGAPGAANPLNQREFAASAMRLPALFPVLAADESPTPSEAQPAARDRRRGISRTEEVFWIVAITILVAFVIAWKLAARSQEDIQRLLNRSKGSTDSDDSTPQTGTESEGSEESIDEVKSDTVPEIPTVTGEDTDPEMPTSSSH